MTILLLLCVLAAPVSQETATLYLYRVEEANKIDSRKTKVFLDDKPLADMPESEYVGLRLPPGKYVIRMKNKHTATPLTLEAGRVYFLRVSETPAGMGYRRDVFVMQAEQALHQMRLLKPLQAKNIKNKTLAVTFERAAETPR